jgi:hypothetical protein
MEARSYYPETYKLTRHAQVRAQQRGIRQQTIAVILVHGDLQLHAGEGLISIRLTKRRLRGLQKTQVPAAVREKAAGIILLLDPVTETVVTVMHDVGREGRRYRRQFETRSRKLH